MKRIVNITFRRTFVAGAIGKYYTAEKITGAVLVKPTMPNAQIKMEEERHYIDQGIRVGDAIPESLVQGLIDDPDKRYDVTVLA